MIVVTWYCQRCGKEIRSKEFFNVAPMDTIDAHDEMCEECLNELWELRKRQKVEIDEFWKRGK